MDTKAKIAILIPCYNVQAHIEQVIVDALKKVDLVIAVNDCSTDDSALILEDLKRKYTQVYIIHHKKNQGVGGAMKTAFQFALKTDVDICVKIDGDGQMDTSFLPKLLAPIQSGQAEMSKGNRFHNLRALSRMPFVRRIGNLGLSFLIKAASGYWQLFDASNGFIAVHRRSLEQLEWNNIANDYFFESSLLIEMNYIKARIQDVAMPAIYNDEESHLSIRRTLVNFPPRLAKAFLKRLLFQYFLFDFNIGSIYLLFGVPLFGFGFLFGLINWIHYASQDIGAPLGTIMVATLSIVIGFQLLLAAIQYDITNKD